VKLRPLQFVLPLLPAAALLQAGLARPLPLFSRGTNEACARCHLASSQLTPAGVIYAIDGNRSLADTAGVSARIPFSVVATAGATASRADAAPAGTGTGDRDVLTSGAAELHAQFRFGELASVRAEANAGQPPSLRRRGLLYGQLGSVGADRSFSARVGRFDGALPLMSDRTISTIHPYLTPVDLDALGVSASGRVRGWALGAGWIDSRQNLHPNDDAPLALRRMNDAYLWLSRGSRLAVVQASMLFDRQDSTLPSLTWMQHLKAEAGAEFTVIGVTLVPGYVFDRFDDRPAAGIHDRHQYFMLQALAPLDARRRWLLAARVEHDYHTRTVLTPEGDRQLGVANLSCEILPGTSVAIEGSAQSDNFGAPGARSVDARIRMVY